MFNLKFKKINKIFNFRENWNFCLDCPLGWISLLVFFSIFMLVIASLSFLLYFKIDKGEIFVAEDTTEIDSTFIPIDKDGLDEIIYGFNLKSDLLKKLKQNKKFIYIDPSL